MALMLRGADSSEVLHDSRREWRSLSFCCFLHPPDGEKRGEEPQCQGNTFHTKVLSRYIEAGLPAIAVSVSLGRFSH